jgi:hypothetical protein
MSIVSDDPNAREELARTHRRLTVAIVILLLLGTLLALSLFGVFFGILPIR